MLTSEDIDDGQITFTSYIHKSIISKTKKSADGHVATHLLGVPSPWNVKLSKKIKTEIFWDYETHIYFISK